VPITGPTDGPLLNIVPLTLTNVPANTDQVTLTLHSPPDNEDSLVWVGANVSYQCGGGNENPSQGADLAVSKTVNDPTPDAGEVITYTVTVTNNGPEDATGVEVNDKLPKSVTFISYAATAGTVYTNTTGLWDVGNLLEGVSAVLTIRARVNDCTNGRTITNTARILSVDQADLISDNNEIGREINVTLNTPCYVYLPIILKDYPPPPCHVETFDDPNSGWLVSPTPQLPKTFVEYFNRQYHMFTQDPSLLHWVTSPLGPYNNYSVQVDAKWTNNTYIGKEYGLVFDLSDNSTMYRFNINTDNGIYVLGRLQGSWITLVSSTSLNIFTGTATNTLKMKRNGSNIDLYINGHYQTSYVDNALPRPAYVGVNINPYDHIDGEAYFDNFTICSHELSTTSVSTLKVRPTSGVASKP
jgi:uncharacterized repeat protein (TIGR01451 family)